MRRSPFPALVLVVAALVGCSSNAAPPPLATPSPQPTFVLEDPPSTAAAAPDPAGTGPRVVVAPWPAGSCCSAGPVHGEPERYTSVNDWGQELWLPVVGTARAAGATWFRVLIPERPNGTTRGSASATSRSTASTRPRGREPGVAHPDAVPRGTGRAPDRGRRRRAEHADGRRALLRVGARGLRRPVRPVRRTSRSASPGSRRSSPSGPAAVGWRSTARADPSDAGRDVSHGCVRVFNPQMQRADRRPDGHPGRDPTLAPSMGGRETGRTAPMSTDQAAGDAHRGAARARRARTRRTTTTRCRS